MYIHVLEHSYKCSLYLSLNKAHMNELIIFKYDELHGNLLNIENIKFEMTHIMMMLFVLDLFLNEMAS